MRDKNFVIWRKRQKNLHEQVTQKTKQIEIPCWFYHRPARKCIIYLGWWISPCALIVEMSSVQCLHVPVIKNQHVFSIIKSSRADSPSGCNKFPSDACTFQFSVTIKRSASVWKQEIYDDNYAFSVESHKKLPSKIYMSIKNCTMPAPEHAVRQKVQTLRVIITESW